MKNIIFSLTLLLAVLLPMPTSAAINSLNGLTGGTQTFTNDTNIRINSSGTAHAIQWINSLSVTRGGTGRKTLTAGQLLFGDTAASVSQSPNLFWDKNNNRLGIGNSTPDALVDVTGSILASGSGDVGLTIRSGNDISKFTIRTNSSLGGRLDILNQATVLLSIASTGFVGVGTTSPHFQIDAIGQVNATTGFCIAGDCKTNWGAIASGSVNKLSKFTGANSLGNSQVYDDGTNVGIGTISPGSRLTVAGRIESTTGGIKFPDGTVQATAASASANSATDGGLFGDGSDGDVIISSDTTLTGDKYYNNLTINSSVSLNSGGYRIRVKGTLTVNGKIIRNGNNGTNGGNGVDGGNSNESKIGGSGGMGGVVVADAFYSGGEDGKNGGNGGNSGNADNSSPATGGSNGTNGDSITDAVGSTGSNAGASGAGGRGGSGSNYAGGGAGSSGTGGIATAANYIPRDTTDLSIMRDGVAAAFPKFKTNGGAGSGSGGGGGGGGPNGTNGSGGSGGGGGGSGSSAGILIIFAKTVSNNGSMTANGGNAGNGGNGGNGGDAGGGKGGGGGGGGGGAGGNGGFVALVYKTLSGSGTVTANGGAGGIGGSGGTAAGDGVNGSNGTNGTAGVSGTVRSIQL